MMHLQSGAYRDAPAVLQVRGVLADTPATLAVAADCTSDHGLSATGVISAGW
jgi:hypothetical protein